MNIPMPDPLREWSTELERLSDASQAAFADWLPRLSVAFGPFVNLRAVDSGEPEGFDGLTHKGRYDRLLLSEWLLADEAPLEFMRRAAAGEHLFHNLAREQPAQSRCCMVLLDAGPLQLGTPRLAQLALLVVLARRAREASARLVWGIAQQPGVVREGFDEHGVRSWLAARTWTPVVSEHLEGWREHLRAIGLQPDERWLISDHQLEPLARAAKFVSTAWIREPLATAATGFVQTLEIEDHDGLRSKPRRSLALVLPSDEIAAAILRDPLRPPLGKPVPAPSPSKSTRTGKGSWRFPAPTRIWTDTAGRRLFARRPDGVIAAFHIPSSAREAPGRPRRFAPDSGASVVAIDARGHRLFAVVRSGSELILGNFAKHGQTRVHTLGAGSELEELASNHGVRVPSLTQDDRGYLLHTGRGALLRLTVSNEHTLGVRALVANARAVVHVRGRTLLAIDEPAGPAVYSLSVKDDLVRQARRHSFVGFEFQGFGWGPPSATCPPVLLRSQIGEQQIYAYEQRFDIDPPGLEETVIGPYCELYPNNETPRPGLLLLDATRRQVIARNRHDETVLVSFEDEVTATTLSYERGLVAAWTAKHRLWAFDFGKREVVLDQQLPSGGSP
jgi:hypothetical protein